MPPQPVSQRAREQQERQRDQKQQNGVAPRVAAVADVPRMHSEKKRARTACEWIPPFPQQHGEHYDAGQPGDERREAKKKLIELPRLLAGNSSPSRQRSPRSDAESHMIRGHIVAPESLNPPHRMKVEPLRGCGVRNHFSHDGMSHRPDLIPPQARVGHRPPEHAPEHHSCKNRDPKQRPPLGAERLQFRCRGRRVSGQRLRPKARGGGECQAGGHVDECCRKHPG